MREIKIMYRILDCIIYSTLLEVANSVKALETSQKGFMKVSHFIGKRIKFQDVMKGHGLKFAINRPLQN